MRFMASARLEQQQRGQAKTRMIRMLPALLDEWCPIIAGIEIPDDPL